MFRLKVTGDPEATVGLVAVDKGASVLNNKHRLTQKKAISFLLKFLKECSVLAFSVMETEVTVWFESNISMEPFCVELACSPLCDFDKIQNRKSKHKETAKKGNKSTGTTSFYKSKESLSVRLCVCVSVCVCASNISADQDQSDLTFQHGCCLV